jgi:sensor histidine kinase regulating citrate/malate metabolism
MEAAMNATVPPLSLEPQAPPVASPCADPGSELAERYWRALQEHLADGSDTRLGLAGIRERINTLGGSMRLEPAPSEGTTVQADIPIGGENAHTAG